MCTLVILRRPGYRWPVLIGANRDEMADRPARPPGRHWSDRPEVTAGLDLLAGGSWLGLNDWGVIAAILNRTGSLGPLPDRRSRGELVLEALDHADAVAAAAALSALNPAAYRSFNLIVVDNRDGFWVRHAGDGRIAVHPLPEDLSLIAAGDIDDPATRRLELARPRFRAAPVPDPEHGDWKAWEDLLADDEAPPGEGAEAALRFRTRGGFATVSSALIALPTPEEPALKPVFRYAEWLPQRSPWRAVDLAG
ncbi:MAG TPA: NRDE family protein [Stellaceae bacterium]|nr:NRDE family protein [Stellaceae bacterium]